MQSEQQSIVETFLHRYLRPEDEISFEIRALATVEIESQLNAIRKNCKLLRMEQKLNRDLGPVFQFMSHPELPVTRSGLEYLLAMLNDYLRVTQLYIDKSNIH